MSPLKFLIDANLSDAIAKGMKGFGEAVEHLKEHFGQDTADDEWLPFAGREGYFVITRDKRILSKPHERKLLREYRVGIFVMEGQTMKVCDLVQCIVRAWPEIKKKAGRCERPFAFRIRRRGGKLERIDL